MASRPNSLERRRPCPAYTRQVGEDERASALEQAIANDIDDEAALQVWSDWLIESGEPLGTVIATWLAIEEERDSSRRMELRDRATSLQTALVTERLGDVDQHLVELEIQYRYGLVRRVRVGLRREVAIDRASVVAG